MHKCLIDRLRREDISIFLNKTFHVFSEYIKMYGFSQNGNIILNGTASSLLQHFIQLFITTIALNFPSSPLPYSGGFRSSGTFSLVTVLLLENVTL